MLIYVEFGGYCGLYAAKTLASGKKRILREHGTRNVTLVRQATKADVNNVGGFGGHVPKDNYK